MIQPDIGDADRDRKPDAIFHATIFFFRPLRAGASGPARTREQRIDVASAAGDSRAAPTQPVSARGHIGSLGSRSMAINGAQTPIACRMPRLRSSARKSSR